MGKDQKKARIIVCHNCSGRGHFARFCKKSSINQLDGSYEFTQFETNVVIKFQEHDDEEFGFF